MYKYSTYKFYLPDGRRIAAFAEPGFGYDTLLLRLFYCSRKDQFSKEKAKLLYSVHYNTENKPKAKAWAEAVGLDTHPETTEIVIDPEKPHQSFLKYMEDNYYKVGYEYYAKEMLYNRKNMEYKVLKGGKYIAANEFYV